MLVCPAPTFQHGSVRLGALILMLSRRTEQREDRGSLLPFQELQSLVQVVRRTSAISTPMTFKIWRSLTSQSKLACSA